MAFSRRRSKVAIGCHLERWHSCVRPDNPRVSETRLITISSPTPPVRRALKHAVEKLQQAGHEIVDWKPELHQEAVDLLVSDWLTTVAVCS